MKTFRLTIEYDGSAFSGWQIQPNARTVQGVLEEGLATILRTPVRIQGAGRTDAGVHALGQVASFRADTHLGAEVFAKGLNSLLPEDIVVRACEAVPGTVVRRATC